MAFANGKGGKLVFGVENGTWTVTGFSKEEVFQKMDAITNSIFDSCEPKITPNIAVQEIDGRPSSLLKLSPVCSVPTISRARASWKAPTSAWPEQPAMRSGIVCRNSSWKGPTAPLTRWSREQTVSEEEIAAFCEKMYRHALKLAETGTAREQIQKVGEKPVTLVEDFWWSATELTTPPMGICF